MVLRIRHRLEDIIRVQIGEGRYDRVSDVVENGVSFASKILTHNRMH